MLLTLAFGFSACERNERSNVPHYTSVNEAYEMLDKGNTSSAIELLERVVADNPANAEARVMLASAYMGKAGIDVLSLNDAFHDVLFSKSLSDIFFKGGPKSPGGAAPSDPVTGAPPIDNGVQITPAELLFEKIDEFLNNVRRVLVILDRFPRVSEERWPMLDQALYNLDQATLSRETRLYRMFIRVIYLKEVVVERVIRDASLGTREWACRMDGQRVSDSIHWIIATVTSISEDYLEVFPGQASPFDRVEVLFKGFDQEMDRLEADAPPGGDTAILIGQRRLRETLRCSGAAK